MMWTKAIKIIAIFVNFYFAFADKFDSSVRFQFQFTSTLQEVANYQIWLHPAEGNRNVANSLYVYTEIFNIQFRFGLLVFEAVYDLLV